MTAKIEQVKEILESVWRDASKWGTTFEGTPAVDNWLQVKSKEIDDLYSQWIEALEKQNKELHNELVRLKDNPSHPSSDLMLSDEEIESIYRQYYDAETGYAENSKITIPKLIAKAQLAHCEPLIRAKYEAEIEELKTKIEQLNAMKCKQCPYNEASIRAEVHKEIGEWYDKRPLGGGRNGDHRIPLTEVEIANLKAGKSPE